MDKSLVVFQEKDLYFGLYPTDFKDHFSLNQVWVSNAGDDSPLWRFNRQKQPSAGVFIHFGSILNLSQVNFDKGGYIFIKEMPGDVPDLGICVSGLLMRVPLKQLPDRTIEIEAFPRIPVEVPRTIFSSVQVYKGKHILVIDPLLLFRAFDIPGKHLLIID